MIQKFKLFIDILFIYICKPFSYTSIRAQTRENYKIYLITEGTVLFFLKVSNISFACLRLVGRIRRNQQHTCACSEFYKQKAHFHRNWYSLPGRFLDVLNLFFFFIYNINCYVCTSEFYIHHCFVHIPCMSVVIPCSIPIKIIYIYIYFILFSYHHSAWVENMVSNCSYLN